MLPEPTLEQKLREAATKVESEIKRAVNYLNDEVVPQVRQESSVGLREAAEQLRKLADTLDHHTTRHPGGRPQP
jgi:bisphosphoglycerate-dependent phosphoglycerate mutase